MDNALWMISVAPRSTRAPVVRCAELEGPQPFAVTVTARSFEELPALLEDAQRQLNALRQEVQGVAV